MDHKNLIIVESFTKTKTISKYLGDKYVVICSLGHICDLPKNDLGIQTESWKGQYVQTKHKIIDNIRKHVKQCEVIYLASDPDVEGEAIAYHIKNEIKDLIKHKQCFRIKFNEITKKALQNAIDIAGDIDQDLVSAQEARRFIDRLVGYKLSPLLWNKFSNNTLSVGRVQSVALAKCVDILQNIESHNIDIYWNVIAKYSLGDKSVLECKLYNTTKVLNITDKDTLESILGVCRFDETPSITFKDSSSSESPCPPYTTTSLQQDAYNKFKFSAKKTMQLAQELYENGHITYMRTDSTHISDDFKNVIIGYINKTYPDLGLAKFRNYKNKIANAQEAHEAIRITNVNNISISTGLSEYHNKLYDIIWKRTIASQMCNAEYTNVEISLKYTQTEYVFKYVKAFLMKKGYLMIYDQNSAVSTKESIVSFKSLVEQSLNPIEFKGEANINNVPSLYTEVSLIKCLEKEGIGRPSTYASIIDKLLSKRYVEKGSNPSKNIVLQNIVKTKKGTQVVDHKISTGGKSKDLLVPTELGKGIVKYLETTVPFLLDTHFTANMENALDRICDKSMTKEYILTDFYEQHLIPIINAQKLPKQTKQSEQHKRESCILNTKYGYCYYNSVTQKYTNIESYLKWRKVSVETLREKDINFIKSLPKLLGDGTELHIGPYGLYLKDKNKNIKLDRALWDSYVDA